MDREREEQFVRELDSGQFWARCLVDHFLAIGLGLSSSCEMAVEIGFDKYVVKVEKAREV